jgi:hypothetical protein
MVDIKVPVNPVQKLGLWPPKGAREYTVLDTDDWWKIEAHEDLDVWALIEFNFHTHVPEEVNWHLRELVGCRHSKDGRNYAFLGTDPKKRKIYLPVTPPAAGPGRMAHSNQEASGTRWSTRAIVNGNDSSACSTRWKTVVTIA